MIIKIHCEECDEFGKAHDPNLGEKDDCKNCQGWGYRSVTLKQLIKNPTNIPNYMDKQQKHYIKSCLNLELLK